MSIVEAVARALDPSTWAFADTYADPPADMPPHLAELGARISAHHRERSLGRAAMVVGMVRNAGS